MDFIEITKIFEKLQNNPKRLNKILILRDFLEKDQKTAQLVFDMICGNFQRQIDKKTIGISLKTLFSIISFLSKTSEIRVEKEFNKIGDIGEVAQKLIGQSKQASLQTTKLTLAHITGALQKISKTSGNNSNKIKKEILGNLFLNATTEIEYKFLARLLIDDLRIGVSEGTLKEASVNYLFPKIIGIHNSCSKCFYINLNSKTCLNCNEVIDENLQNEIFENRFKIVEIRTLTDNSSNKVLGITKSLTPEEIVELNKLEEKENNFEEKLEFTVKLNPKTQIIQTPNPRYIYKKFLENFEKKYNTLNSFSDIIPETKKDLASILKVNIEYFRPIKSMLGLRSNTVEHSFEVSGIPAVLDYKYDGLRVQIHSHNGHIELFSRNLDNITKQFPEILEFIKQNFPKTDFVLDSETVGYDFNSQKYLPFQMLSKRILSKNINEVNHIKVVVKAFDILKLDKETLVDFPYEKRRDMLEMLFVNTPIREKIKFDLELLKNIK
jgi:ATP-dependent DNA ligase